MASVYLNIRGLLKYMLGFKSSRLLLPITALIGIVLFFTIANGKPEPAAIPPLPVPVPSVTIEKVAVGQQQLWIDAQGVVEPAVKIALVSRVAGRIEWVSEQFASGGSFAAGDELLRIESADYEIALSKAKSALADARRALAMEKGSARQAKREWRDLGSQEANELFLRIPQLRSAEAAVEAAKAGLHKAELDVQRTRITATFDGRVLNTQVDIGQFVAVGHSLGEVFGTDKSEIRLAVSTTQRYQLGDAIGASVLLYSETTGHRYEWPGRIARVESAVDTASRQYYLVVEVEDPYQLEPRAAALPPLVVGQFLQARVAGVMVDNAASIMRKALRLPNHIWVLDEENKLQVIDVEILYRDSDTVVVRSSELEHRGLFSPLSIVVSDLSLAISGLQTRVTSLQE